MRDYQITGFADEIDPSLDVQLAFLNRLGVDYMEIRGVDGKNVSELSLEEARAAQEKLQAAGVSVSAIGSPIGKYSITEDFTPHFDLFRHVAELCGIFKCPYIRMFSFFIPEGKNPEDYREEVLRRLRLMAAYAKEKNLVLLHENEKGIYGDTAPRCLELMQELYCDNFQAVFDFANFIQCGQETLEAYKMLKPYIRYIHVKDAVGPQVVPAGMGEGNVLEILDELLVGGYKGYFSLEPHLSDFSGFSALEHADARSEKLSDGKFAWWTALNALKAILYDLEA